MLETDREIIIDEIESKKLVKILCRMPSRAIELSTVYSIPHWRKMKCALL